MNISKTRAFLSSFVLSGLLFVDCCSRGWRKTTKPNMARLLEELKISGVDPAPPPVNAIRHRAKPHSYGSMEGDDSLNGGNGGNGGGGEYPDGKMGKDLPTTREFTTPNYAGEDSFVASLWGTYALFKKYGTQNFEEIYDLKNLRYCMSKFKIDNTIKQFWRKVFDSSPYNMEKERAKRSSSDIIALSNLKTCDVYEGCKVMTVNRPDGNITQYPVREPCNFVSTVLYYKVFLYLCGHIKESSLNKTYVSALAQLTVLMTGSILFHHATKTEESKVLARLLTELFASMAYEAAVEPLRKYSLPIISYLQNEHGESSSSLVVFDKIKHYIERLGINEWKSRMEKYHIPQMEQAICALFTTGASLYMPLRNKFFGSIPKNLMKMFARDGKPPELFCEKTFLPQLQTLMAGVRANWSGKMYVLPSMTDLKDSLLWFILGLEHDTSLMKKETLYFDHDTMSLNVDLPNTDKEFGAFLKMLMLVYPASHDRPSPPESEYPGKNNDEGGCDIEEHVIWHKRARQALIMYVGVANSIHKVLAFPNV